MQNNNNMVRCFFTLIYIIAFNYSLLDKSIEFFIIKKLLLKKLSKVDWLFIWKDVIIPDLLILSVWKLKNFWQTLIVWIFIFNNWTVYVF